MRHGDNDHTVTEPGKKWLENRILGVGSGRVDLRTKTPCYMKAFVWSEVALYSTYRTL